MPYLLVRARSRLALFLLAALAATALPSCGSSTSLFVVELRTDYAPGVEFFSAVALAATTPIDEASAIQRGSVPVTGSSDASSGLRVAALEDVPSGPVYVRVTLLDLAGAPVASQDVRVQHSGTQTVTVVLSRACGALSCPGAGDPAEATSCRAGRCVTPDCAAGTGDPSCPSECSSGSDCPSVGCRRPECADGVCLGVLDDSLCGAGLACVPPGQCADMPDEDGGGVGDDAGPPGVDAGPIDAGPPGADAGPDAGPDGGMDAGPPLSDTYCPNDSMSRAQAAVFIVKLWHRDPHFVPPVVSSTRFSDVPPTHVHADFIEEMARLGITQGCTSTTFCPNEPLVRYHAAVFILRAFHRNAAHLPPNATGRFDDVNAGQAPWVEEFANTGFTSGCTASSYCPNDPTRRSQGAIFIERAFHGPAFTPPAAQGIFSDVPAAAFYAPYVEHFALDGFTRGC